MSTLLHTSALQVHCLRRLFRSLLLLLHCYYYHSSCRCHHCHWCWWRGWCRWQCGREWYKQRLSDSGSTRCQAMDQGCACSKFHSTRDREPSAPTLSLTPRPLRVRPGNVQPRCLCLWPTWLQHSHGWPAASCLLQHGECAHLYLEYECMRQEV